MMDYKGLKQDLLEMAYRARIASGLTDRRWRMKALSFADDCADFFFDLCQR